MFTRLDDAYILQGGCIDRSIIEVDQIQVAAFSLEHFSYLTRSPWANENASIKCAKAGRLIKNEPHYLACVLIGPG